VAIGNARCALDQISHVIQNPVPTSPIVLQSLLRTALLGAARTLYVLLPPGPNVRLERGRTSLARDCESGRQALETYAAFEGMKGVRPPPDLVEAVRDQREDIWPIGNPPGDGKIVEGMTESLVEALKIAGLGDEFGPQYLRDHTDWLWHTYSGAAYCYLWPRLLWGISADRRIPGDFPLDPYQVAVAAHMAVVAVLSRSQPDTAGVGGPGFRTAGDREHQTAQLLPGRGARPSRHDGTRDAVRFRYGSFNHRHATPWRWRSADG
jgi:hypothetical protein